MKPNRNRTGPPRQPAYRNRNRTVIARVTASERVAIDQQADQAGTSVSELVRSRLLNPASNNND